MVVPLASDQLPSAFTFSYPLYRFHFPSLTVASLCKICPLLFDHIDDSKSTEILLDVNVVLNISYAFVSSLSIADVLTSNRYSMPVTLSMRQKRESAPDFASSMGLSQIDTTSGLFRDDDDGYKDATASPDVKSYLQANTTEDKFPILVRSNHKPGTVSIYLPCRICLLKIATAFCVLHGSGSCIFTRVWL